MTSGLWTKPETVSRRGAATETVWLETRDRQRVYRWGEPQATRPLFDPAGAARRVATGLRRERLAAEGSLR